MESFKDAEGRDWEIKISVETVRNVQDAADMNLFHPLAELDSGRPLALELQMYQLKLAAVLWPMVEGQAEERDVSRSDFESALDGGALDRAREALFAELRTDLKERGREAAVKALDKQDEVLDKVVESAGARMENVDPDKLLEKVEQEMPDLDDLEA